MRYGYAYDKSRRLMNELGASGFPSAALIDANGVVQWVGHPASLKSSTIEKALVGALPIPMWEWPKSASGVRKALQKTDYATALKKALELEGGDTYVEAVRGVIAGRLSSLEQAFAIGDFLGASESVKELKKSFKGLPEQDRVNEIDDAIKSDKSAGAVIKAQKDIVKLAEEVAELRKRKDAEKILDKLRKIQQKNAGTYAADQAGELADDIRKLMPNLR